MRRYGRVLHGSRPLRAVRLEESEDVIRILGILFFLLSFSWMTLSAQAVQAALANPELSPSYQSEEGEKKEEEEEEEDEEPDCE
jgi:hypothetical protein